MVLQAAARRIAWINHIVLAKWEKDSYAQSHINDELRRLYHADENLQQLNDAAERIVLKTLYLEYEFNRNIAGGYTAAYIKANTLPTVQAPAAATQDINASAMPQVDEIEPEKIHNKTDRLPGWILIKPKRILGYGGALYNVLKDAHDKGGLRPTAHEVIEAFAINKPHEVERVLPGEGLDYYTTTGSTKHANIKAIRQRILQMTKQKTR